MNDTMIRMINTNGSVVVNDNLTVEHAIATKIATICDCDLHYSNLIFDSPYSPKLYFIMKTRVGSVVSVVLDTNSAVVIGHNNNKSHISGSILTIVRHIKSVVNS
jgi:hypothetical protein